MFVRVCPSDRILCSDGWMDPYSEWALPLRAQTFCGKMDLEIAAIDSC